MFGARLTPGRERARQPELLGPLGQEVGVQRQDHRRGREVVARFQRAAKRQPRALLRSVAGDRRVGHELGLGEPGLDAAAQVGDDRRRSRLAEEAKRRALVGRQQRGQRVDVGQQALPRNGQALARQLASAVVII